MAEGKLQPHGLWRACYGLTQFEFDEERATTHWTGWALDAAHSTPIVTPLFMWAWMDSQNWTFQYWHDRFSVPASKGIVWKIKDGYFYFTVLEPAEEEIPKRAEVYREKVAPFIEDFWGEWQKVIPEWMEVVRPFKELDLERLSDYELRTWFFDYLYHVHRPWSIHHHKFIYSGNTLYGMFDDLCRELLGVTTHDVLFKKVMSGFDNTMFRVNKELWRLGDRARELGLGELFTTIEDDEQVLKKLEQSEAGRKWLEEYGEFIKEHGWRPVRQFEWATPTWIEKPSLPIADIRRGIIKGGAFVLDEERERLAKEREEAEKELLAKVPSEQREWFEKLMRVAQMVGVWSEDHAYYIEFQVNSLARHITKEIGRRLAQAGAIDNWEDIYFLMPPEIEQAIVPRARVNLRPYVEARRQEWEEYRKIQPVPMVGEPEKVMKMCMMDPALRVVFGMQLVRPELKADLYGMGSAPGITEGTARVLFTVDQLKYLQPGEILVCPMTFADWIPAFSLIGGVVTDSGASLSHAIIIAREYGMPAVSGTLEATSKIKTGNRIKVDGDNCCVYILE